MKYFLMALIYLITFNSFSNDDSPKLCFSILENYLENNSGEPWNESAYISKINNGNCLVRIKWHNKYQRPCSFAYNIDLQKKVVLYKEDYGCWHDY